MTVLSLGILSLIFIGLLFLLILINLGGLAALLSGFALTGHLFTLVAILLLGCCFGGPFLFCLAWRLLYHLLLLLLLRFRVLRTGGVGINGWLGGLSWRRSRSCLLTVEAVGGRGCFLGGWHLGWLRLSLLHLDDGFDDYRLRLLCWGGCLRFFSVRLRSSWLGRFRG